jgi:hypothetical protein
MRYTRTVTPLRATVALVALCSAMILAQDKVQPSFAESQKANAQTLRQYSWTSRTEIKLKGESKNVKLEQVLTDAEGIAFWPVYDAYQKDLQAINQRLTAAILAYADAYNKGPVTNETAKKLLDESLAIDEAEAKLKSASAPKILAALPATKAARYIQIENKIRAAVRYELAAGIPLVE